MTLDQLIEALQTLQSAGHGSLNVVNAEDQDIIAVEHNGDDGWAIVIDFS